MTLDLRARSPLMLDRIAKVERDLGDWAKREPQFDFDPTGTHLFSKMELLFAFAKRAHDLAAGTRAMLYLERTPPAVILARALIETTAMGCFYVDEMLRLVSLGKLENLSSKFSKFYAGVRGAEISSVHVNDAIRHLELLDTKYFQYLSGRHEGLSEAISKAGKNPIDPKFVQNAYDLLSEVAHPSGTGTQLLYPAPGGPDISATTERLRFSCEVAIWQNHHLLKALERGQQIPRLYKEKFLT